MSVRIRASACLLILCCLGAHNSGVVGADNKLTVAPCKVGRTSPPIGFWTWPSDASVNIYLREPDFSASDVAAVKLAVENWDATSSQNGSNVRFTFHGLTRALRNASGEITIVRKAVFDKKQRRLALLEAHSRYQDGLIDYALILVDPSVRSAGLLTSVVAHEIGHSLGLMDCYKCDDGTTAMALVKTSDESNRLDGPTACDQREVRATYKVVKSRTPRIADAE